MIKPLATLLRGVELQNFIIAKGQVDGPMKILLLPKNR